MTTTERSVEEMVEEFYDRFSNIVAFKSKEDATKVCDWLTQTLQTERQKREEMVEAERERFGKILSEIEIGLKNSNGSKLEIEGIIWTAHEAITNHNNPKWYDAKIGM